MTPKKAKAPRPVAEGREAEAATFASAQQVFDILVRGESVGRLAIANVPLSEKIVARTQTRMAWQDVVGLAGVEMDVTGFAVIAWLARRASGEPNLTWLAFQSEWDDSVRIDEVAIAKVPDGDGEPDPQP